MKRLLLALAILAALLPVASDAMEWKGVSVVGGGVVSVAKTEYTVYITENTTDFNSITYSGATVYTGVSDTYIKQASATTNFSTNTTFEANKYADNDWTMGLISFPGLSNIPSTATVLSVEFGIYRYGGSGNQTLTFHRLLQSWVISEATWNIYSTGNSWDSGGASTSGTDYSATSSGTISTTGNSQWGTNTDAQLAADVQDFVDGSVTNFGWRLERTDGQNDENYNNFRSSQNETDGQLPYLKVVYEN